jgi:hypothetical protein
MSRKLVNSSDRESVVVEGMSLQRARVYMNRVKRYGSERTDEVKEEVTSTSSFLASSLGGSR